ncbi:MAG: hypothetical protein ACSHXK_06565 [Oceanococcus sp.]
MVDVPDAAINLAQAGPSADPMVLAGQIQTSVESFVNQMTNLAFALNGDGACDEDHPQNPFAGNPFAGTPLEVFVDELSVVADALDDYADLENPELTDLTDALDLSFVAAQLALLPVAGLPVAGDIVATLANTINGVDGALGNIGALDDAATRDDVAALVNQLLQDVLTAVVPVAGADTANNMNLALGEDPADVAGTVAALLATLGGNYGADLESVIPANFATLLNSVSSPSAASFADLLGGSNPLEGVLAELAGGGVDDADLEMLTALLLANDAGLPVDALAAALGGNVTDVTPIEALSELNLLVGNAAVDTLLESISLESLISQVSVISAVSTIVDESILGLLGIDLGDFLDNLLGL